MQRKWHLGLSKAPRWHSLHATNQGPTGTCIEAVPWTNRAGWGRPGADPAVKTWMFYAVGDPQFPDGLYIMINTNLHMYDFWGSPIYRNQCPKQAVRVAFCWVRLKMGYPKIIQNWSLLGAKNMILGSTVLRNHHMGSHMALSET